MATMQSSVLATGSKQQLADEHTLLDTQLEHLHQKRFLTPEEELEAIRLKKLKLQVKDAMQRL
ncbi:MAG: DUF465 domain-containing protein [Acidobacteria bacterium]|nr:MAG: DUF465 domain-containing protein [Acidobacteriota bacterium]